MTRTSSGGQDEDIDIGSDLLILTLQQTFVFCDFLSLIHTRKEVAKTYEESICIDNVRQNLRILCFRFCRGGSSNAELPPRHVTFSTIGQTLSNRIA